jgi:hypothetical protein
MHHPHDAWLKPFDRTTYLASVGRFL